jgi:hypothetical protein
MHIVLERAKPNRSLAVVDPCSWAIKITVLDWMHIMTFFVHINGVAEFRQPVGWDMRKVFR